jgi:hypothetical protein
MPCSKVENRREICFFHGQKRICFISRGVQLIFDLRPRLGCTGWFLIGGPLRGKKAVKNKAKNRDGERFASWPRKGSG